MTSPQAVSITSYNMHKGMSALNRKVRLDGMVEALGGIGSDILFLQEVQGHHSVRSSRLPDFPDEPHYDVIGERLSYNRSYGKNAVYPKRHHGNAILTRMPLITKGNLDISVNKFEQRGMLHCEVFPDGWSMPLVCLCAHLNLLEQDRIKQYQSIFEYVNRFIDPESPLIIAGDFNDWRRKSDLVLGRALRLKEAFRENGGRQPKTFPARLPMLSLDRVYIRNLKIVETRIHNEKNWQHLSDHLPLSVRILPL